MRLLYLLNRVQRDRIKDIRQGKESDDHLYGMLRLPRYGIETDYVELEKYLPARIAQFVRKYIFNIYWAHLPFFFKFFAYDAVFASTAFGSQFFHTLYPFKKPKWIMLDFGLSGFLGEGKTFKQKLLAYMISRAAGIVTIDAHEKKVLERRYPSLVGKIEFIRFAVDTEFFKPRIGTEEENLIFSPGRDPGRDFKTLFEAAYGLDARIIATARPWTIRKISPLPPFVTNEDLTAEEYVATFAKAAIVVIPLDTRSLVNNAMGLSTLVEAMAMGKAVIATWTHATESYIQDGVNGLLVPANDEASLREAIMDVLSDCDKRMRFGTAARKFVVNNCEAEKFAHTLAEYMMHL